MREAGLARRAHSRCTRGWQSWPLAAALLAAAPAHAGVGTVGTSVLTVLTLGKYVCELPGDALSGPGRHMPDQDFTIIHASTYTQNARRGAYLLTGNLLTMTTGPLKGARYRRITDNFLRRLNTNGSDGDLRCIRGVPNNL